MRIRLISLVCLAVLATVGTAAPAEAAKQTRKKAIWGPVQFDNGKSAFPTYKELGVGIFQELIHWDAVAPTRPILAQNPNDPTYKWPSTVDYAVRQAKRHNIRVSLAIMGSPGWANGGRALELGAEEGERLRELRRRGGREALPERRTSG